MVTPVVGPINEYITEPFSSGFHARYRQAMPIDRPLPYRMYYYFGRRVLEVWTPSSSSVTESKMTDFTISSHPEYSRKRQSAYNLAYEKLRAKVSDQAGWAENFAQINKTRQTVIDRSLQLARFTSAVRHGDFGRAARALRTPIPSKVSHRKAISQNWLEFEFGVKPVVQDLQTSLGILLGDPSEKSVQGRASENISTLTTTRSSGSGFRSYNRVSTVGTVTALCSARVRVTNPNLALASSLGLIDLALPWKLIPFSFVVDWFVNVEQVISSVTDWYGVALVDAQHTYFRRGSYEYDLESYSWNSSTGSPTGSSVDRRRKSSVEMDRVLGLPGPALIIKPFKGLSIRRGANALALVLSVLGK